MITRFEQFLLEAISLSQAKEYTKIWKDSGMENYLNAEFKGKYRIYIPLKDVKMSKVYQDLKRDVETVLSQGGYETINYYENQCKKVSDKNITKITKTLTKLKRDDLTLQYNTHLQQFDAIAKRGKNNDLTVVISRHPIDIAGMSTGRWWYSCMNLDTGAYHEYVEEDVKAGTIIAYLIQPDDTNIENPMARILMKPFINRHTKKVYLFPEKVYGPHNSEFYNTVEDWLKDLQGDLPEGLYDLHSDLYDDSQSFKFVNHNTEIQKITKTIYQYQISGIVEITPTSVEFGDEFSNLKFDFESSNGVLFFDLIFSGNTLALNNVINIKKPMKLVNVESLFIATTDDLIGLQNLPKKLDDLVISASQLVETTIDLTDLLTSVELVVNIDNANLINIGALARMPNTCKISLANCTIENFTDLVGMKNKLKLKECKIKSTKDIHKLDDVALYWCDIIDDTDLANAKNVRIKE